jgi:hypothetical protein
MGTACGTQRLWWFRFIRDKSNECCPSHKWIHIERQRVESGEQSMCIMIKKITDNKVPIVRGFSLGFSTDLIKSPTKCAHVRMWLVKLKLS